jgi:hypothetical protein
MRPSMHAHSCHLQSAVECISDLAKLRTAIDDGIAADAKEVDIILCPGCVHSPTTQAAHA